MVRWLIPLILLTLSCSEKPDADDIESALELRYRWFGDVVDVRVMSLVKVNEESYFAQVKYGVRFRKDLEEMERELLRKLEEEGLYRSLGLLAGIVTLNELVQKCGRITIRRGQTCYLSASVELVNVRGSWTMRFR